MKIEFLLLGIGVGCWMYAFVNSRYDEKKWLASKSFWWIGFLILLTGLLLWIF